MSFGTGLASGQCQPCEPRLDEGDERDRKLAHAALSGHVVPCEDCSHARNGNTPSQTTARISPSLGGRRGVPCDKITNKLGQSIRPLGQGDRPRRPYEPR
jgi:hypothetical protein